MAGSPADTFAVTPSPRWAVPLADIEGVNDDDGDDDDEGDDDAVPVVMTAAAGGVVPTGNQHPGPEGGMVLNSPASTVTEGANDGGDGEGGGGGGGKTRGAEKAEETDSPELDVWRGAGGAGWGPWSHVDMQLVIGQASKHRVREGGGYCVQRGG